MGVVIRWVGLLTTGPIINGSVVNSRVNDPFAVILVLGGHLVLRVAGNMCYINHSGTYVEINFNMKISFFIWLWWHLALEGFKISPF